MIVKKNDVFPARPIITVIYGTPGTGKTSVATTAKNPILIDCDRGADRACNKVDTVICSRWEDVVQDKAEFGGYDTIVIDTAKACLDDYLQTYVCEQDYKLKTNKMKMYGAIGDEFKAFVNEIRAMNADIVIIAHAKETADKDAIKVSPDVTGQSKDLLLRIADQVGYLTMVNNKRTIVWSPTDTSTGKNVANLPATEIPDVTDAKFQTFMASIIEAVRSKIQEQNEEQKKALENLARVREAIAGMKSAEDANRTLADINGMTAMQKSQLRKEFVKRCEELKLVWNKETKAYEAGEGNAD